MERISAATTTLPSVLWQTGRAVTQTLQDTSMLKVGNSASLKVSGGFPARRARENVPRAKEPRYPRTEQKAVTEPLLYSIIAPWAQNECPSQGKGARFPARLHRESLGSGSTRG